jgi:ATP-binding cassette, subfamily B, bacterial MsbA
MKHFKFLFRHWFLFAVIIATGICIPVLDGLIFSFVFPALEGFQGIKDSGLGFPFKQVSGFFVNMDFPLRLKTMAILLVGITLLKGILFFINGILSYRLQIVTLKHFNMTFFKQLMRIGIGYLNSRKYSDLYTLGTYNITSLYCLIVLINNSLIQFFNIAVLLVMLILLSWKMTLVSLLFTGIGSLILRKVAYKAEFTGRFVGEARKFVNNVLLNGIRGGKTIRLFNRENNEVEKFEKVVDDFNGGYLKLGKIKSLVRPAFEATGMFCLAVIIIASSFIFPRYDAAALGTLMVFIVVFQRISKSVMELNNTRVEFVAELPIYREFFNFLDTADKHLLPNGKERFTGLKNDIEFRKVRFSYGQEEPVVLNQASFIMPKGKKTGIVGTSGAGKSTLAELLLRFYDPLEGSILVDGRDLRDIDINSWRKNIGVVSQDVFLFNDTVRANIAYAKPDATQQEIEAAARKAYAHEFIQEFPKGYDTLLGERGVLLSGGQRQRIAIARAIIINPEILVFDEATSSLDSGSEKIVQRALDEVGEGKTVFTIAHRLSTVFDSDKIIVVEAGNIVEQGAHQELLRNNGLYRKLVSMQELEVKIKEEEDNLKSSAVKK